MSKTDSTEALKEIKNENHHKKRIRHRKKQIYENITKQMEFYFSNANLTKDRFLGELVKKDPYVPVDIFLKFNKIKALTQDVNYIVKAIKTSTTLELSDDKLKIRRKEPITPYDADSRTVYVESIPVTASREWLERVFSDYGKVTYISLPKFKNTQRIKGYGFIEFDKPEEAQKCLNTFTKMGCKLPTSMSPEELSSIRTFSTDEPDIKSEKLDCEPPKKKAKKNKEKKPLKNLEVKAAPDPEKEIDTPTSTDDSKSILPPIDKEEIMVTDVESKDELTSHDESKEEGGPTKKKTRKRTAKERNKAKIKLGKQEAPKGALWGLQVLPKVEWKALRNKYLNLQRKYMKEIKMNLQNNKNAYSEIPAPAMPSDEGESAMNSTAVKSDKNAPLEKISGVFVKEILSEPCLDVRAFKRTVRSNVHALHVEVKEGQSEAFIRFDSSAAAQEYCSKNNLAKVLVGAEEEEQWARAEVARSSKRMKGRERLVARHYAMNTAAALTPASPQPTHTHIRFDEE